MAEEYYIKKSPNFVIIKRNNESFESLMNRFKRKTKSSRILVDCVEKMFFVRPSEKKKKKKIKK